MSKGQGSLSRVFGSIFKYQMQRFRWQTCIIRPAGAISRVSRGMLSKKFLLFGLSKMQFLALSESELVKLDGLLRH